MSDILDIVRRMREALQETECPNDSFLCGDGGEEACQSCPRHALLADADAMLASGGWIPVSERLPEEAGRVQVRGVGGWCEIVRYDNGFDCPFVVHYWQPVPQPLPSPPSATDGASD
jgi:hypothetical protein